MLEKDYDLLWKMVLSVIYKNKWRMFFLQFKLALRNIDFEAEEVQPYIQQITSDILEANKEGVRYAY